MAAHGSRRARELVGTRARRAGPCVRRPARQDRARTRRAQAGDAIAAAARHDRRAVAALLITASRIVVEPGGSIGFAYGATNSPFSVAQIAITSGVVRV